MQHVQGQILLPENCAHFICNHQTEDCVVQQQQAAAGFQRVCDGKKVFLFLGGGGGSRVTKDVEARPIVFVWVARKRCN